MPNKVLPVVSQVVESVVVLDLPHEHVGAKASLGKTEVFGVDFQNMSAV